MCFATGSITSDRIAKRAGVGWCAQDMMRGQINQNETNDNNKSSVR